MMSIHRAQMSQETFVAHETARYNHTAVSPSFTHYLIPSLFMLGFMFLLYEMLASVICKLLDKMVDEKKNS